MVSVFIISLLKGAGPSPAKPDVQSGSAATQLAQQQQQQQPRQQVKSRHREFKAVYLTAAIVGAFVVLWSPHMVGRLLDSAGYSPVVVNYVALTGGAIGSANFAFAWLIYAAVSRSYRRAYRQVLVRIGCCSCCRSITPPAADNSLVI